MGWYNDTDNGVRHEKPLRIIEGLARELLRGYSWPGSKHVADWPPTGYREALGIHSLEWRVVDPDWVPNHQNAMSLQYNAMFDEVRSWPDMRGELLTIILMIAELRSALALRCFESALLRAMTIGTLLTRIADLLLVGTEIASGAERRFGGSKGGQSKAAQTQFLRERRTASLNEIKLSNPELGLTDIVALATKADPGPWKGLKFDSAIRIGRALMKKVGE